MSTILLLDPFATKGLLTLSELDSSTPDVWHGFHFEGSLANDHFSLAETEEVKLVTLRTEVLKLSAGDFSLPDLDPSAHPSTTTSDDDEPSHNHSSIHVTDAEDIWKLSCVQKPGAENKLVSWDRFLNQEHEERQSIYLSERGTTLFDTLLYRFGSSLQDAINTRYARRDLMLGALFDLALGRSSIFFTWNDDLSHFTETYHNYTLSGVSEELLRQVTKHFAEVGAHFHLLEQSGHTRTKGDPARVALTASVVSVLHAVKQYVVDRRFNVVSLVRLLDLYDRPIVLIKMISELMQATKSLTSQGQLSSAIISHVEQACSSEYEFENVFSHIVSRVLQPLLQHLYGEVGLVQIQRVQNDEFEDALLNILPASTVAIFASAKASLHALRDKAAKNYDILTMRKLLTDLKIHDSWDAVIAHQEQADKYEQDLKKLISGHSEASQRGSFKNTDVNIGVLSGNDLENPFLINFDGLKDIGTSYRESLSNLEDPLQAAVASALSGESVNHSGSTIPCRMALDLSITPFLKAQHRLLSYSVIQLLFSDHHLGAHLDTLNRFQLLGDGWFASRLSTALFDSEQTSGEGRRKTIATTGLRLHSRGTWPPASSEVRLVLMGILSESLSNKQNESFIDSISFAIRDLSDEDLERCRDVNSIHALDFLHLRYKSTNPIIDHIITPQALNNYDKIFNHLLRLLRLKALTQSLTRQFHSRHTKSTVTPIEHQLRHEFHHFITSLASYSQTTAILTPWLKFNDTIQQVQSCLNKHDYEGVLSLAGSLDDLRRCHETTLQQIKTGLLLRKNQSKAKQVLDQIMGLILSYAKESSLSLSSEGDTGKGQGKNRGYDVQVRKFHVDFRQKVIHLMDLLGSLSTTNQMNIDDVDEGGNADGSGDGSEVLEQLRLRLDFTGFYSRLDQGRRR